MREQGKKNCCRCSKRKPVFLLFLSILLMQAGYSQNLSLNVKKAPLESVFREIESQVPQRFVYTREMLKDSKPVTIQMEHAPLQKILEQVFKGQPLVFEADASFIKVRYRGANEAVVQEHEIRGVVYGENGTPLAGATILLKKKNQATVTDPNGRFSFKSADENEVLLVTFTGYESKEIAVKGRSDFNIHLEVFVKPLDETVVIAYGSTTRRLNTGSVSKVSGEEIERQPVSNPIAALQGRVPGLVINQSSGVAGSVFKVEIRGRTVLDANLSGNEPLIIIDGVPFEAGNGSITQITNAANNPTSISQGGLSAMNSINPADIESIEVLKDADATAIYGSRGANGVILITTKKGKPGKTSVMLNYYKGWSKTGRLMPMLNTKEYLEMRREAFMNEGVTPTVQNAPDLFLWDTTRYTDFSKLLDHTADVHSLQATVSGGTVQTQFLAGLHWRSEGSVFGNDLKDQVKGFRLQGSHESTDKKFMLQAKAQYSEDENRIIRMDLTRLMTLPPHIKMVDEAGKTVWQEGGVLYNTLSNEFYNPVAELNRKYKGEQNNLLGNVMLHYSIFEGLRARLNAGYNVLHTKEVSIRPSISIDPNIGVLPSASFGNSKQRNWIAEPQLEWQKVIKKSRINLLTGGSFQHRSYSSEMLEGNNYANDLLLYSLRGAGSVTAFNNDFVYRYSGFFGRISYNYDNRYLLNLNGRRDGSSRFAPENRFSNFGSVGGAWIFSKENWFKSSVISHGKLRGSYGVTGNDQIGDYKYLNLWTSVTNPYGGVPGLMPRNLYNPEYNWERTRKLEAAIEMGFFNDRLQISGSYYRNRSSNQLVNYTLPGATGFFSVVQNLPAIVENRGIEAVISSHFKIGNIEWSSAFNVSFPKNELVSFPGLSKSTYANSYTEGSSLSSVKRFVYNGVDPTTGLYSFHDKNGDGVLDANDYVLVDDLDPKYYGGLSNSFQYKGFSLHIFFEFKKQVGRNYLNQLYYTVPGTINNHPALVLNRWKKPGDIAEIQRYSSVTFGPALFALSNLSRSNAVYSDASYIRLKNAAISFELPEHLFGKTILSRGKLYLEGQNLLTITNFKGTDPETQNFFVLPPLRTIAAGIQLNF